MPALAANHRAELVAAARDIRYAITRYEYSSIGAKPAAELNIKRALAALDALVSISTLDPWIEQAAHFYGVPPTLVNPSMRAHVKRMFHLAQYAAQGEYVASELTR